MNFKKWQRIGVALMAASVLSAILIQAFTGRVLAVHPMQVDKDSSGAIFGVGMTVIHLRYAIPLVAGFAVGLACWAWPARKPPRIIS
jgi:hypothetical protein